MTSTWQRGLALTACAAGAASLLAACAPGRAAGPGRAASSSAPASPAPGQAQHQAPATGLRPAPAGITDRLIVPRTRLRAGLPVRVTLLVNYAGQRRLNLNRGCRPQWAAVLTNHQFPPD